MTTYVMRDGKLVLKSEAAPLRSAVHVISDTMNPLVHPSNGKVYDSKSRFRAETRARGLTEVGNEKFPERKPVEMPPVRQDIMRAIHELGGS